MFKTPQEPPKDTRLEVKFFPPYDSFKGELLQMSFKGFDWKMNE
jgi:hypothetical protein